MDPTRHLFSDTGDASASPHGSTSGASLQEQLAGLIGRAIGVIESHLETLHLQEHQRLRKNCEEQIQRISEFTAGHLFIQL
ncbi:hypothetical protein HPB48_014631 [Haemaphysalis longicornis]|uniref:Uncharacterized protein n=1 Tax=Haemaphysalis longicornis TaxID=44386 RepID=A0A9J6GKA2_HAELO|nr:hypothetical protein HPB48_014631 [Haemaphysalis longicornis]